MVRDAPSALLTMRPIKVRVSPAMAAGVIGKLWEIGDVVDMLEAWEVAN